MPEDLPVCVDNHEPDPSVRQLINVIVANNVNIDFPSFTPFNIIATVDRWITDHLL